MTKSQIVAVALIIAAIFAAPFFYEFVTNPHAFEDEYDRAIRELEQETNRILLETQRLQNSVPQSDERPKGDGGFCVADLFGQGCD